MEDLERKIKKETEKCDRWNLKHIVGLQVYYYPVAGREEKGCYRTKGLAFVSSSGTPVIFLDGISGYIHLDHIKPRYKDKLTDPQAELLVLQAKGFTNIEAADILGIKLDACNARSSKILENLGVKSRVEAVRYALEEGMA